MTGVTTLALDAGNTRVKWGFHDGDGWIRKGAVPTAAVASLAGEWSDLPAPTIAVAANVAGAGVADALSAAVGARGPVLTFVAGCEAQCGVRSGYDRPSQMGADRWAAAIGAWAAEEGACVIVNAGTAVTVDALSGEGVLLGGFILPGVDLMRDALVARTAQLRDTQGVVRFFPANTADAITSGIAHALCGAIERMAGFLARTAGASPVCIISGGAAGAIAPHLDIPVRVVEHLVLDGLLVIARGTGDRPQGSGD